MSNFQVGRQTNRLEERQMDREKNKHAHTQPDRHAGRQASRQPINRQSKQKTSRVGGNGATWVTQKIQLKKIITWDIFYISPKKLIFKWKNCLCPFERIDHLAHRKNPNAYLKKKNQFFNQLYLIARKKCLVLLQKKVKVLPLRCILKTAALSLFVKNLFFAFHNIFSILKYLVFN